MTVINTNSMSLNAQRNLGASRGTLETSIQRLSSGLRVNSAKDDAAGLAIANRMDSQVRGMNVAIRNANDAISMSQVAEGTLGKVTDMLQRMRELAVQSKNATNTDTDRNNLDSEYQQLNAEINRSISGASFNGISLFNATAETAGFEFQVGAGSTDTIGVSSDDFIGDPPVVSTSSISTASAAATSIDTIDAALTEVNTARAKWGATQNRFEVAISTLQVSAESLQSARGRIIDADFAKETAALTRAQILQQAGTAMLAQANAAPQGVLSLLRG
jgi:flagellin